MRHPRYFLLTPRPTLADRLKNCAASQAFSSIAQTVLWSAEESDRSNLRPEDVDTLVKLLFLDTLHREQGDEEQFSSLFPNFSISEQYFDLHWSLARAPLEVTLEEAIEDAATSGSMDTWMSTNNPRLDEVLAEYKRRASGRR